MPELPSQPELRRRLKAVRALRDVTIAQLAERLPAEAALGERTLRKLEGGESQLRPPILRELAAALDVPYEWFVVADPMAHLMSETTEERIAALERAFMARVNDLEARLANPPADTGAAGSGRRSRPDRASSGASAKRLQGARRAPAEASPPESDPGDAR